jgi:GTP-binding protein
VFVDRVKISVQAGNGGDGCVSFRREKYVPLGGPNGGDGGHGGSVILLAQAGVDNLAAIAHRQQWKAGNGEAGKSANCRGRNAEDLTLLVPPGTLIINAGEEFVLKDLVQPGDSVTVAHGGRGGWGNTHFKSSTNRAPRQSTPGQLGEGRSLILELKSIADVGLIGKPNAGKSTLLSRLSRARPEIADYPFTTKSPNLGRVSIDRDYDFLMADIPGLIEGAHTGVGLGHEFLRHIERAGILVHLVEPEPVDGSDPIANYDAVTEELRLYNPGLVERPEVIVVSKAELPAAEEARERLAAHVGRDVLLISSVTGRGLNELIGQLARLLAERREAVELPQSPPVASRYTARTEPSDAPAEPEG